jgi:hypothetical protein
MDVDLRENGDAVERLPRHVSDTGDENPARLPQVEQDAGLRARQLAEHARYRQVVAAADQEAAKDQTATQPPWAKAAAELRTSWEEHTQRYPERARLTPGPQPDGSWVGDGNQRLTPEHNAEVGRAFDRIRETGRLHIIPVIEAIEAEDPARNLAGFEHRFKGEHRFREKVADQIRSTPGMTPAQAMTLIPDAVRSRFSTANQRIR